MTPGEILLPEGRLETGWWGPGPQATPTLVLLHEGLGSLGLWRDFPARLAAATGCGVFAFSRFGYGHSDPAALPRPLDYLRREACEVLPRVLDAAGLQWGLLLGHSDGGSIAAIHAGLVRDPRLRGIVVIAPHFVTEPMGLAAIEETRGRYEAGELRARLARHHRHVDVAFRGWCDTWLDPRFPASFDLRPDITGIRVPVLAIQGEADPYGTPEQLHLLAREAAGPVEVMLLPGIGHAPQAEAPEAVLHAVRGFVARLLPPGGEGGGSDARAAAL
ncbi:alpha/beta fold hydrolase [Roseicella aquatilis]|uniref:Alpha/beta hydrolase n=1 Tax=Roseicella aquatilis TaxID=2527868 RepID=A0A4R4DEC4_9PROT|nr:alpha/beta hydrolase [Roseicella aquatilis]TCZ58529.1 alpha/beta hydrolase [Roseicella aquatilis]